MIEIEQELKTDVYGRELKVDDFVAFNSQGRMAVGSISRFLITKGIIQIKILTPQETESGIQDQAFLNNQFGKTFNVKSKVILMKVPDIK